MVSKNKLGTKVIDSIAEDLKEVAKVVKLVSKDGKVDPQDLPHVIALVPKLPKIIDDIKKLGEAIEEGKDLDIAEIVGLIQKVHAAIKEVEGA